MSKRTYGIPMWPSPRKRGSGGEVVMDPEYCPICGDIMEPDDVTGEVRCMTEHAPKGVPMPLITRSDDERLGVLDTVSGSPPPIAILYRDSLRAALEELRTIDEVLARRPALAEQNNRVNKILHAIVVAKNCDAALVRATVAEAEVARLNKVIAEMTRLRAALAARDTLAGQVEEKDKRIETLTRWNNNAARLRDEAEAQLCGVKEIMSNVAFPCAACEQVIDALSSSAPCPHEEEAKRWKEYAEHQEHCATCGEAVSDCAEGSELRRRAGRKP